MSRATPSMKLKSTEPSGCGGVGTAIKITSDLPPPRPSAGGEATIGRQPHASSPDPPALARRWASAPPASLHLGSIAIDTDDLMPALCKAGPRHQPNVSCSNNGNLHGAPWLPPPPTRMQMISVIQSSPDCSETSDPALHAIGPRCDRPAGNRTSRESEPDPGDVPEHDGPLDQAHGQELFLAGLPPGSRTARSSRSRHSHQESLPDCRFFLAMAITST
jgi:hypothetical protein